ncbi:hypothetical protein P1X14_06615 [Sphingomonas sp. AOB5]|uniref:hypothetical protein n=1 Tax=Sphingomonas sp. AOB5 TaxID=3034017 RepID=UPI0023F7D5EA|nr:hypothetical protein [Sphingomonas sp. AOB5]MDF7774910.1 hypothetical protein [Sphingomonas sp. AOB5]
MIDREFGAMLLASLAAAAVPALVFVLFIASIEGFYLGAVGVALVIFVFGWAIALLHLLLALPLYNFLRTRGATNWGISALAGAVIGGLPLTLIMRLTGFNPTSFSELLYQAIPAVAGLAGGLTFRWKVGLPEQIL